MSESPTIRTYQPRDLEACRSLWTELTQVHRDLYEDPTFGGDDPGLGFDEHLAVAEGVWAAYESEGTGEAWIVQPGREPLRYEFKGVPGPR